MILVSTVQGSTICPQRTPKRRSSLPTESEKFFMGLSTDTKTGEPEYPHVERNSTAKLSCGGVFGIDKDRLIWEHANITEPNRRRVARSSFVIDEPADHVHFAADGDATIHVVPFNNIPVTTLLSSTPSVCGSCIGSTAISWPFGCSTQSVGSQTIIRRPPSLVLARMTDAP
jgi:hypothetical protein